MNKYKKLVSNAALISAGTFGSKLLVFLMVRFYTGYLSPADYGTADIITQTANLLVPLFSLGITEGVFRFAIGERNPKNGVFTAGFLVVTAGSVLIFAAVPLLGLIPAVSGYAMLIAVFVAADCYHALAAMFVRATGDTALFAVQGLLNTALVIALNIFFLAVLSLGITGYVLSVAAANIISTLFLFFKKKLWRQFAFKPERGLFREMLRYSLPLIPTTIFWWVTSVSDRYMVSAFLGSGDTGIYSVAYKIPTILVIISSVFMEAWQLSAVSEAGDRKSHIRFYSSVWRAFFAAMFICASGIIAFSKLEISLLAAESYFSAWSYIPLLSLAMVFSAFSTFMGSVYIVKKTSRLSLRTSMVGALLNIVLNLLLIPSPMKIQGAALATFASYFVVFLIRAVSARELIPFRLFPKTVAAGFIILAVQSVFIIFQLPLWEFVQALGIGLSLFFGIGPMIAVVKKLGFPLLKSKIQKGGS